MAEIVTHIQLGKDINNRINCSKSINHFSLGPDVFYFSKKYRKIARKMHTSKVSLFFKNYINYIKDNHLESNEIVIGSLYGFLSHYILDKNVHPYIYYKSGLYPGMHRSIEMSLTKYYLLKNEVIPNKYKIGNDLDFKKNEDVIKLLNHVLKETYNIDNGGYLYYKQLNKTKLVYRLFRYDRYGIKKCIYKIIDKLFNKHISNASFYNIEELDLNISHNTWYHPCTNEISKKSLIDLYDDSLKELESIINKVNEYLISDTKNISLDKVIGNKSYLSGIDCDSNLKMKYFYTKI